MRTSCFTTAPEPAILTITCVPVRKTQLT